MSEYDNLELTMKNIQYRSDIHLLNQTMHQLRAYLAGALCTVCGEPLGDEQELTCNDEGETMHKECSNEKD